MKVLDGVRPTPKTPVRRKATSPSSKKAAQTVAVPSSEQELPSHELFAERARAMLALIADARGELGLNEAISLALERYGEDEARLELQQLAYLLGWARQQALLQQLLDDDREALHSGRLDHEGRVSTGHHYEMLRREACEYNHRLRNFIEAWGHYVSRDELMGWLVEASQGRWEWVRGEVTGAVSEIALHAALQGLPELRDLRYATLDEDLAGYDFVADWKGQMVTVDAKTGFYRPLSQRKRGHRHLEVSVPREAVHDFQVSHRGLDLLRHEVRQALGLGGAPAVA